MNIRMNIRRLLAIVLTIAMVGSMIPAVVLAATDGYFTYTVQDGEATITSVSDSASGVITIPAYFGRFPVRTIGGFGSNRNITEVIIPEGVRTITGGAFYYCENLARVTIPESVTTIGNLAFGYCMSLKSVEIPGNVETIEPNTFEFCSSMTSVRLPDTVTSIGDSAFQYCYALTDINFPTSLTTIGKVAFSQCRPKNIHLPSSLEEIGENAFLYVRSTESITVEAGNANYSAAGNCLIDNRSNTLMLGCDNSVIPADAGIVTIGSNAFAKTTALMEVTIPQGVKTIDANAFYQSVGLKTVTVAGSVESIGSGVFSGCSALETVVLNPGLKKLGDSVFNECSSLTSITLPDGITTLGVSVFNRCIALTSVNIPGSVSVIPANTFESCVALERVTMGEGITSIGSSAFRESGLKSVTLPQSLTTLNTYAFMNSKLKSISLGSNVTTIGSGAFYLCDELNQVWYTGEDKSQITIEASNNKLVNATWHYGACEPAEHSFDSICDGTCDLCGYDRSVSHIFDNDCDEICNLCQQTNPNAHTYAAGTCSVCGAFQPITGTTGDCIWTLRGTVLTISGTGYTYIEDCLGLPWGTAITEVTVEEGVINLDGGMFYECTQLSKVSLPSTLTTIEWAAFYGCSGLTEIGIPKSVTPIGSEAFDYCTALTDVWYEGNNGGDIYFGEYNEPLINASWHNNSCMYNPDGYDHSYVNLLCEYCGKDGNTIVSIEIEDVELIEKGSGYYDGDDFYYYEPTLYATVTWQDGTTQSIEGGLYVGDKWCSITTDFLESQYNKEPWMLGNTYTLIGTLLGVSSTFQVTIVEGPIQSIEVQDIEIVEKGNGYYDVDNFFYYLPELNMTVTWQDGTTESVDDGVYFGDEWYRYNTNNFVEQNREPWVVGNTYIVTATLINATTTFQVTIVESPIASIAIEDVALIENGRGYYDGDDFIYYGSKHKTTITWKDGTTKKISNELVIDGEWYYLNDNFEDLQFEDSWTLGNTYTVTATLLGVSTTYQVTIVPTPVESVVIQDVILYEGIDSDGYEYSVDIVLEQVLLKDGTYAEIVNNSVYYDGQFYNWRAFTNDSDWEPGDIVTYIGEVMGVRTTFNATILENPIQQLEIIQMPDKTEYLDNEQINLKGATIRVHYVDGSFDDIVIDKDLTGSYGKEFLLKKINRQVRPLPRWDEGENGIIAQISLGGKTCEFPITIKQETMESISIRENDDKSIIITVHNTDGTCVDAKLLNLGYLWEWGEGEYRTTFFTDKGQFSGYIYADDTSFAVGILTEDEQLLWSNQISASSWFAIREYIEGHYVYFGYQYLPEHYSGVITPENIDAMIKFAIGVDGWDFTVNESIEEDGNWYTYDGETLRQLVMQVLALDSLDLTMSDLYDPQTDTYRCCPDFDGGDIILDYPNRITFCDGIWTVVSEYQNQVITMKLTEDHRIISIRLGEEPGNEVEAPEVTLKYPSLSFEDEILYNVYYSIDDVSNVVEMGLVTFATRDVNGTVANALDMIPGFVSSGSTYMARSRGIPAKNLGDTLYFKVYAKLSDGSYVYSDIAGYHAVAYAKTVLNDSASSAKAKSLVVAMLNYGAAAQKYFGYKTDALMNAVLTAEQQALVKPYDSSMVQTVVKADASKVGSFVMDGGYSNIWPTVSFKGAFAINFYFTPSQTVDDTMTLYYWDAETYNRVAVLAPWNASGTVTMSSDGSNWGSAVEGISAKAIDETVYVAALYTSGGVAYSTGVISYSLGQYCKTVAANGEAFGAATAVYGYYAKAYFN